MMLLENVHSSYVLDAIVEITPDDSEAVILSIFGENVPVVLEELELTPVVGKEDGRV